MNIYSIKKKNKLEIYQETRNVKMNGETSRKFCTKKEVKLGCLLSPSLFTLCTADLENYMKEEQADGVIEKSNGVREQFWTLAYADDIILLTKKPKKLKEIMKRLEKYLREKELVLVDKSKIVFGKGRRRKKKD